MKKALCEAFCDAITVTRVPVGLAVSTVFLRDDGDRIGFYVLQQPNGDVILEDDGTTVPFLEASGVDFSTDTRSRAFSELLEDCQAFFDEDERVIRSVPIRAGQVGLRAMGFVSMLIRMNDFLLLTQERVASTFKEDAAKAIRESVGERARIRENEVVSDRLNESVPDMVIEAAERSPVAVYFGNSSNRVHEAVFLQMVANQEAVTPLAVIALLESDGVVPTELRRRAMNRLASVVVWRDDEAAAVARISREAVGLTVH